MWSAASAAAIARRVLERVLASTLLRAAGGRRRSCSLVPWKPARYHAHPRGSGLVSRQPEEGPKGPIRADVVIPTGDADPAEPEGQPDHTQPQWYQRRNRIRELQGPGHRNLLRQRERRQLRHR